MNDLILGNEINEYVVNRQAVKIQFLQQENLQLQEQLQDLEQAFQLNKILLQTAFEKDQKSTQLDNDTLAEKFRQENIHLHSQIQKLITERNVAQNKLLLQQQISEENQQFYQDMIRDQEEKIHDLRSCIYDKEQFIQEQEKNRQIVNDTGSNFTIKEILTPHEQTLRLNEELESTRAILNKLSLEIQNLAEQNNILKDINSNYKRELIKLRIVLRNPISFYQMKEFIYNDICGQDDQNLQIHQEYYEQTFQMNNSNNNVESGHNSDKIQPPNEITKHIPNKAERIVLQQKLQKSEKLLHEFKNLFELEKLKNILTSEKYHEIQKAYINLQSVNETLIQSNYRKDDKISKLLNELSYYKKEYSHYITLLKNKRRQNFSFDRSELYQNRQQNFHDNAFNSKRIEQKSLQTQDTQKVELDFQEQTKTDEQQKEKEINVSVLEEELPQEKPKSIIEDEYLGFDAHNEEVQESKDHFHGFMSNIYSQDKLQDDEFFSPSPEIKNSTQLHMSIHECKQFLLTLAKELYLSYNLRMNNFQRLQLMNNQGNVWKSNIHLWNQKSSSNPLDYFRSQQNQLDMKPKQTKKTSEKLKKKIKINKLKEQKIIFSPQTATPFQLDVSQIQTNTNKLEIQKKKSQKISFNNAELSFISNENVLEGIKE